MNLVLTPSEIIESLNQSNQAHVPNSVSQAIDQNENSDA